MSRRRRHKRLQKQPTLTRYHSYDRRLLRFETLEDRRMLDGAGGEEAIQLFSTSTALFVENQGQWENESVHYGFDGPGVNIAFTDEGLSFLLTQQEAIEAESGQDDLLLDDQLAIEEDFITNSTQFSVSFDGANTMTPIGLNMGETRFNYFIGDQSNWAEDVPGYKTVAYQGLYDGIDLHTFGRRDSLKYEFYVAPGADYKQIQVSYDGIEGLWIDDTGHLRVETEVGQLVDDAPYIYQVVDGKQVEVAGRFGLLDATTYTFTITGKYDPTIELIVDPSLDWSTYLGGGNGYEEGNAIAIDNFGNILVTGMTESTTFLDANINEFFGRDDAFLAKLSEAGTLQWATYLGGSGVESGEGVAIDNAGNALLTGWTSSTDFSGANNASNDTFEAFVAKVSSSGSLQWATYLGGNGSDEGHEIAVDSSGHSFVTGWTSSSNFSDANNTKHGGTWDVFVAKVSGTGSLQWATYLGGNGNDKGEGIAVDSAGYALVTGETTSANFAEVNNSIFGGDDAFLAKVSSDGILQWATYLGGSGTDIGWNLAVESIDSALVTGQTTSTDFSEASNAYLGGNTDAFIARVSSDGILQWSTYLGGSGVEAGKGVAFDGAGYALVSGLTASIDFVGADNGYFGGSWDAFVTRVDDTGTQQWATYLGGSNGDISEDVAINSEGHAFVTGLTSSHNFLGANNDFLGGNQDVFLAKIMEAGAPFAPLIPKVTVITHGWDATGGLGDNPPQEWQREMAIHILERSSGSGNIFVHDTRRNEPTFGEWIPLSDLGLSEPIPDDNPSETWANSNNPTDEIVLLYNWIWDSNDTEYGWLQAAADNLFASLLDAPLGIGMKILNGSLHFIGHSRGAVVNSLTTNLLGHHFDNYMVDQVTTLDPHPIWASGTPYEADDPPIYTYENVRYADNYYQQNSSYQGLVFDGVPVPGANDVELINSVLYGTPEAFLDGGYVTPLSGAEHSDVHMWYAATIKPSDQSVEGSVSLVEEELAGWWTADTGFLTSQETSSGRDNVGYARSRIVGANRNDIAVTDGYAITPPAQLVANGNFSHGDSSDNEIPGWERHGGGGTADLTIDGKLHLGDLDEFQYTSAEHNPLFVPENATKLTFDYEITDASLDDELHVYLGNLLLGYVTLDTLRTVENLEFAIDSNYQGTVNIIRFELSYGETIDSDVLIDNVDFLLATPPSPTGDFNLDWRVDGLDFLTWQRGYGKVFGASVLDGDATGDYDVDADDLAVWEAQYGTTVAAPDIVVDSLNDELDGNYNSGDLSFREALFLASDEILYPGANTIRFSPSLFIAGPQTMSLSMGQLVIDSDVTVVGPGRSALTIDAGDSDRVLHVTGSATANISSLTLTGGFAKTTSTSPPSAAERGGGVFNQGTLNLKDVGVTRNKATIAGGGIYNDNGAHLALLNTLVAGNAAGYHGGIASYSGTLYVANSAIVGNRADSVSSAIVNVGTATIVNSTITHNALVNGDGAVDNNGSMILQNSIVALNGSTTQVHGVPSESSTYSLIGGNPLFIRDPSSGADGTWGTSDDDYGDLRLAAGSSAIDTGSNGWALDSYGLPLSTDFAGDTRIVNGTVDKGAYEYQLSPLATPAVLTDSLYFISQENNPNDDSEVSLVVQKEPEFIASGSEYDWWSEYTSLESVDKIVPEEVLFDRQKREEIFSQIDRIYHPVTEQYADSSDRWEPQAAESYFDSLAEEDFDSEEEHFEVAWGM